jgi:flagellar basal body-associated protein FliL
MACGHRRSRWISVIIAVGLAATGSALAFLWRAFGNNVPTFPSFGSAMEYPHWMVVAGAVLVVAGFIGPWISGYINREPAKDNQRRRRQIPPFLEWPKKGKK